MDSWGPYGPDGAGNAPNGAVATRFGQFLMFSEQELVFRGQLAHPWDPPWGSQSPKHRFSISFFMVGARNLDFP